MWENSRLALCSWQIWYHSSAQVQQARKLGQSNDQSDFVNTSVIDTAGSNDKTTWCIRTQTWIHPSRLTEWLCTFGFAVLWGIIWDFVVELTHSSPSRYSKFWMRLQGVYSLIWLSRTKQTCLRLILYHSQQGWWPVLWKSAIHCHRVGLFTWAQTQVISFRNKLGTSSFNYLTVQFLS